MLSARQQGIYRPLVAEAWQKHCLANGADPADRSAQETWYRVQLVKACGHWTTKQVSPHDAEAIDAILMHFALLAHNDRQIKWVAASQDRRALWRLRETMRKAGVDWRYVRGILKNMHVGNQPPEDLPAAILLKVNAALCVYVQRHRKSVA